MSRLAARTGAGGSRGAAPARRRAPAGPSGYFYIAASPTGGRRLGVRQATSERALADSLRRERLILTRAYKAPAWLAGSETTKLPAKDQAALNEQIGQLLSRGVPLVETLEVAGSVVTARTRPIVDRIRRDVAGGASFSDACQRTGIFDKVTVAIYQAAERTGDLAGSCEQLAKTIRRRLAVAGKAATLLIYPMIVLTISLGVSVLMVTVLVPQILGSLVEQGATLPFYSRATLATGEWLRDNALLAGGAVALGVVGLIIGRRAVAGLLTRATRFIPGVREVVLAQESARFFAVMAAMTRSGIPLADALEVSATAVSHRQMRAQLQKLRSRLVEGGLFRQLVEDVTALPLATRKLLVAAERAGDLERAFDTLADDTAAEVDTRTARLLAGLEPALIVVMFLIIGSLVLSIMIPMITSAGAME